MDQAARDSWLLSSEVLLDTTSPFLEAACGSARNPALPPVGAEMGRTHDPQVAREGLLPSRKPRDALPATCNWTLSGCSRYSLGESEFAFTSPSGPGPGPNTSALPISASAPLNVPFEAGQPVSHPFCCPLRGALPLRPAFWLTWTQSRLQWP